MCITNEEVRRRAGIRETISDQVARQRWTWLGQVLRMDHHSHLRIALTWVPEGKRTRGRPRETWRRTVERDIKDRGLRSWAKAATAAKGEGENNLEGESVRPNSTFGETWKLMMTHVFLLDWLVIFFTSGGS